MEANARFDQSIPAQNIHQVIKNIMAKNLSFKIAENARRNRFKLTFDKFDEANDFIVVFDTLETMKGWFCYIPEHLIYKAGIIRNVDTELSDEENSGGNTTKAPTC